MKKATKAMKAATLLLPLSLISCVNTQQKVTVTNDTGEAIGPRLIELSWPELKRELGTEGFYVTDASGREVPSQLTHDSLLLFKADVAPGESMEFVIHPADSVPTYPATVYGQLYAKRRDDISYENEKVGFRIYGPGTQQAGERAFGYDIFFKYPGEEIIVPQLYAPETDPEVWAKVDSLRVISDELADEFIQTFSYHIDHGKGMDCYAVGPTLGAGVAAIATGDSIRYPWCYDTFEILDNGPLRFTVRLDFAPVDIDGMSVTEHRLITLDSESRLNQTTVNYEGLTRPVKVVAGFPLRDDTAPVEDIKRGIIAYSDPTQGPDNGRALLGIRTDNEPDSIYRADNHILEAYTLSPETPLKYYWGFSWDKADIPGLDEWHRYLILHPLRYTVTR